MKPGRLCSFAAAVAAALCSTIAVGETYEKSINLNVYDDSKVFTVEAGDTCNLRFTGDTFSKKFAKEGNGNITIDNNASFTLASFSWKGAGVLTVNDTTFKVSGTFGTYGNGNEQTNVFNNCTLTAGTFANDNGRSTNHRGFTFFNGGTYSFQKFYVCGNDWGSGSEVYVRGGAEISVGTELFCVRLTDGRAGVARFVIEDGSVTTPQINLGWANATQKQGAVELLGGTLTTKTIVNGPGNADYVLGNGGAFVATTKDTDILPSGIEHVYIGINGMTVDSDVDVTISKAFEPWSPEEGVSETGPLYKTGTGKLTLTGDASAHDKTVITGGSLAFGAGVTTHPAVELAEGGSLDWTGCTTKLAGLVLSGGTLKLGLTDTIELTEADSFDPQSVTFDLPDISTIHTTYNMVKVPGQVSAVHAAAWAAMTLPEVPEIIHTFKTVYDEASDTTTYVLSIEIDPNVKRQITVTAGEGGSVDFESGMYPVDTELSVTATPDAGYVFTGWTGDIAAGHEFDNPYAFVVGGQDIAFAATFDRASTDMVLDLSGGDVAVEVKRGCICNITSVVGNSGATATFTGGGSVVLPDQDLNAAWGTLVIDGVMVEFADAKQFGGAITVLHGGGLRIVADIEHPKKTITFTADDEGVVEVAEGFTYTVNGEGNFLTANATVRKTGKGTLYAKGAFQTKAKSGGGKWVVADGIWKFGSYQELTTGNADMVTKVLEVDEGAELTLNGVTTTGSYRNTIGDIVLRGGTLRCENANTSGKDMTVEAGTYSSLFISGDIIVKPSSDGTPAKLVGTHFTPSQYVSGTGKNATVIDVEAGATLVVDGTLCDPDSGSGMYLRGNLVKRGEGEVKFLYPLRTTGTLTVEDGVVEFAGGAGVDGRGRLVMSGNGRIRLTEGGRYDEGDASSGDEVLASADVWLDATQFSEATGDRQAAPNRGTQGGNFLCNGNLGRMYGYEISTPTLTQDAINGLPAIELNKAGYWLSYVNKGTDVTVYSVGRTTGWGTGANEGHNAAVFSMAPTGGSDTAANNFHLEYSAADQLDFYGSGTVAASKTSLASTAGTDLLPYLDKVERTAAGISFTQYRNEQDDPLTATYAAALPALNVGFLTVGGRATAGLLDWCGKTDGRGKMYRGQLGELLVFNRKLSDDEAAYVEAYLKNKWFGTSIEVAKPQTVASAKVRNIEVPAGEVGALGGTAGFGAGGAGAAFVKSGEGALAVQLEDTAAKSALDVVEGTATFGGQLASSAAIWLDADDPDVFVYDDGAETVKAVLNKGSAGGRFEALNATASKHATVGTIGERASLHFPGTDVMRLTTFTYRPEAKRDLYVYFVKRRNVLGTYTHPFAFVNLDGCASGSCENVPGCLTQCEEGENKRILMWGNATDKVANVWTPSSGVPYVEVHHLDACHATTQAYDAETDVETKGFTSRGMSAVVPADIDCWQLGGRINKGSTDRFWQGDFGEVIVFTHQISTTQERELIAYLQKKWFGTGDGSATPPAWLSGEVLSADTANLTVTVRSGATLEQSAVTTVGLEALAFEDGATLTRTAKWAKGLALFELAGSLDFGGTTGLSLLPFPRGNRTLFTYGETCTGFDPKAWSFAPGSKRAMVSHDAEAKQIDLIGPGFSVLVR